MTICVTGGAGLVGQNLVHLLIERGYSDIVVLDKSANNIEILRAVQPQVEAYCADLSVSGDWQQHVEEATVVISLQAQIGGLEESEFHANNVVAAENICQVLERNPHCYVVHISSSVLDSQADDFYTRSKTTQEGIFSKLPNPHYILRPTLMFGWFDRKHLGWLSRFMKKIPLFPIPGHGRYLRQPLYVRDFCRVILACVESHKQGGPSSISGKEKVNYIDMIREIKRVNGAKTLIANIPYGLFYLLLRVYALFDGNPPFTISQLQALIIDELFEDTDWETEFGVKATPFSEALEETFCHPTYSDVVLDF